MKKYLTVITLAFALTIGAFADCTPAPSCWDEQIHQDMIKGAAWLEETINKRTLGEYEQAVSNWRLNYNDNQGRWDGPGLLPLPIPRFRVDCDVKNTPYGWDAFCWNTDAFIAPPFVPSDDELRRMPEAHRRELGLPDPPPLVPTKVINVGPRLPDGRFAVGPGDNMPAGTVVTHTYRGETFDLVKKMVQTPFGFSQWYAVKDSPSASTIGVYYGDFDFSIAAPIGVVWDYPISVTGNPQTDLVVVWE